MPEGSPRPGRAQARDARGGLRIQIVMRLLALLPLIAANQLAAQATQVEGPLGQRLDSVVRAAEARGFHGNILVADQGRVVLLKGYGLAIRQPATPYTPATLVQIGSNVKDMTRTAVYQLMERGRLRLNDSLGRFFADVPADKRGITIQQLMDHRAGLPLGLGGDSRALTRAELLRDAWAAPLGSTPGTQQRYSNAGYSLLAVIVEDLSGVPFDRYVAENILRPAGLTETGSEAMRFDRARVAHGYNGGADRGTVLDMPHDTTGHLYQLRGNGGYLSTLSDMRRFYAALRGPTLLRDEASRRAVFNPDEPGVFAGSDMTSFFLYGNFPGAGAEIIIASNTAEYRGNRLLREIMPVLGIQPPDEGGERVATQPMLDRLPDTGPGRTVAAYLAAFNTGDSAAMRRFFEAHALATPQSPPMDVRLQRYRDMYGNLGRLTVRGVRMAEEGLTVVAAAANGETVSLTFILEAEAPYRLRGVRVEVG